MVKKEADVGTMSIISALRRLRQEGSKFKVILSYKAL